MHQQSLEHPETMDVDYPGKDKLTMEEGPVSNSTQLHKYLGCKLTLIKDIENMDTFNRWKTVCFLLVVCFALNACATLTAGDPKKTSSWQAPQRFNSSAVFSAALKALSQSDLDIVSHDRQAGIISARKVVPIPGINIPSEVPIAISISKNGGHVVLSTIAYLKGMGTGGMYEEIIQNFYSTLFLYLKVNKPGEQVVNKTDSRKVNKASKSKSTMPKGRTLVAEVQTMLTNRNYDPGPADGFWGNKTESALKAYQDAAGLPVTGEVDERTYNSLKRPKSKASKLKTIGSDFVDVLLNR